MNITNMIYAVIKTRNTEAITKINDINGLTLLTEIQTQNPCYFMVIFMPTIILIRNTLTVILTHLHQDNMAAISQTIFSDVLS